MIEHRFCNTKCKREMKRLLDWDEQPLKQGLHDRPHYLSDWAWKTRKFHKEGEPGNIEEIYCGWQRRDHKHE